MIFCGVVISLLDVDGIERFKNHVTNSFHLFFRVAENGINVFTFTCEDDVDTPFIVQGVFYLLDIFDIQGIVIMDYSIVVFYSYCFHCILFLHKFTDVIHQVGEPVKVVCQVVPISVELGLALVADQGTRHCDVFVFSGGAVEDLFEKFLVSHNFFLFLVPDTKIMIFFDNSKKINLFLLGILQYNKTCHHKENQDSFLLPYALPDPHC